MLHRRRVRRRCLHVGGVTVHLAVVAVGERQAPNLLADRLAGFCQSRRQLVVIGEKPGAVVPERHDDGAGQGREVDHQPWLRAVLAVPHGIGQNEPALGIGIQDFDRSDPTT